MENQETSLVILAADMLDRMQKEAAARVLSAYRFDSSENQCRKPN